MKNEEILFDLITEVRTDQKEIRQDLHKQSMVFAEHLITDAKMYEELSHMNKILDNNTESLKEHMRQTMLVREQTEILKNMYQNHKDRLDEIEKPITVKETVIKFAKVCSWVSAIASAVYGISRFL